MKTSCPLLWIAVFAWVVAYALAQVNINLRDRDIARLEAELSEYRKATCFAPPGWHADSDTAATSSRPKIIDLCKTAYGHLYPECRGIEIDPKTRSWTRTVPPTE